MIVTGNGFQALNNTVNLPTDNT